MPRRNEPTPAVDRLFRELPSSYVAIASALRSTIRAEGPALSETVKWNNPFWTGEDDVLCLQCFPDHVNLAFLRGAELSVAHPEIVGTGRAMRHVKIRTVREAKSATVRRLIRAAIELDSAH